MVRELARRHKRMALQRLVTLAADLLSILIICGDLGVFNVLEGCHGEIEMTPGLTEDTMGKVR